MSASAVQPTTQESRTPADAAADRVGISVTACLVLLLAVSLVTVAFRRPAPAPASSVPILTVRIALNEASAAELSLLPEIGDRTAAAIVADREAHGPFARVEDLQRIRGIGPATVEAVRPFVTVTTRDGGA